jgi:hypothetical protein
VTAFGILDANVKTGREKTAPENREGKFTKEFLKTPGNISTY